MVIVNLDCDDPSAAASFVSLLEVLKAVGKEYALTFRGQVFQFRKTDPSFMLGKRANVLAHARYPYSQFFSRVDIAENPGAPITNNEMILIVSIDISLLYRELMSLLTTSGIKIGEGRATSLLPGQPFLLHLRAEPAKANSRHLREHLRLELGGNQTAVPVRIISTRQPLESQSQTVQALSELPRFIMGVHSSGLAFFSPPASTFSAAIRAAHQLSRIGPHPSDTIPITVTATGPDHCKVKIGPSVETTELNVLPHRYTTATIHMPPSLSTVFAEMGHLPGTELLISIKDGDNMKIFVIGEESSNNESRVMVGLQIDECSAQP